MAAVKLLYDESYQEHLDLEHGMRVRIRPIRPSDRARLKEGFHHLSPRSRYERFFALKPTLTAAELRYLTEVDGTHHVAIGAVRLDQSGEEADGLAVARFVRYADHPETAEAALTVADDYHGMGLGGHLWRRLIAAAAEREVGTLRCYVLEDNEAMLHLVRSLAPERQETREGAVLVIEFDPAACV